MVESKYWHASLAADLADALKRMDRLLSQYPLGLKTAGDLRTAIANTRRELAEHELKGTLEGDQ